MPLATTANAIQLDPAGAGGDLAYQPLLDSQDPRGPAWRTVLIGSEGPCRVRFLCASGGRADLLAECDYIRGGRFGVYATHVRAMVATKYTVAQRVSISVADAFLGTDNVLEEVYVANGAEQLVIVPAYAYHATLWANGNLALVTVNLYDGYGVLTASFLASDYRSGFDLGSTRRIGVTVAIPGGVRWRILYKLSV